MTCVSHLTCNVFGEIYDTWLTPWQTLWHKAHSEPAVYLDQWAFICSMFWLKSSHLGELHHYTWYHQISIHKRPPHNLTFYYIQTKVTSLLALDKLLEPSQSFLLHGLLWPVLRVISCFRQSLGKVPHVNLFHLEDVIQGLLICLWVFVLEHGAVHRSGLGHCLPLVADIWVIEIHIFKQFLVRFSTFASHSLHSHISVK